MRSAAQVLEDLEVRGWLEPARAAARAHGVRVEDLVGRARSRSVAVARGQLWTELHDAGASYPELGAVFGRDHTSVLAGVRRHKVRQGRRAGPGDATGHRTPGGDATSMPQPSTGCAPLGLTLPAHLFALALEGEGRCRP